MLVRLVLQDAHLYRALAAMHIRVLFSLLSRKLIFLAFLVVATVPRLQAVERTIDLSGITNWATTLSGAGSDTEISWVLPRGYDELVLPISAGVCVDVNDPKQMQWLRKESPWSLTELPVIAARYGNRFVTIIVPWPHYAELAIDDRVAIKFTYPKTRTNATPSDVVAMWTGTNVLDVANAFRQWRDGATNLGSIPKSISLKEKAGKRPDVAKLFGALHLYLWGSSVFSRHDVPKTKWQALANHLKAAKPETTAEKLVAHFEKAQREALEELSRAEAPMDYLTSEVAAGIADAITDPATFGTNVAGQNAIEANRTRVADALEEFVNPPSTWGDGPSISMLNALHDAGIERAVLVLSDLYGKAPATDVAKRAKELGYAFGPYDSYHSIHDPKAPSDKTWETAQFDANAYEKGPVLNEDGSGHHGFRGNGFHFAPATAWPYVQKRVSGLLASAEYSAWFVDCDATAECFDDYNPLHFATRVDDINVRRDRLKWLADSKRLVVGSEGGSILFSDVVDFGHGVQTPYIGHLDKSFRDPQSPHFLGKHFPADSPQVFFKRVTVPPALLSPYFDPMVRVPLYRAAIGDELIASHHWSFDSLKFSDVSATRALLDILYMTPPMYHINRATWPQRKALITRYVEFWSPLHKHLATASLKKFEWLTADRLVQRTTYSTAGGDVLITVNFGKKEQGGYPAQSATVAGSVGVKSASFRIE